MSSQFLHRGNNFCDLQFTFLDNKPSKMGFTPKRNEFAPRSKFIPFKSKPLLRRDETRPVCVQDSSPDSALPITLKTFNVNKNF